MIRLIQRRLIIPRGDTGSFTIPVIKPSNENIAVFTIFDETTHTKLFQKRIVCEGDVMNIAFSHSDTVNLKPGKYLWDIKYYSNPLFVEDELVDGEEIDSYYAGYSLPACEIRPTGDDYLVSDDAPSATLAPDQLNIIRNAIIALNNAVEQTQTNVEHYPIIRDEIWYVWDAESNEYVSTGVDANGIAGNGIASAVLNDDYSLTLNFTDGTTFTSPSIRGETGNGIDDIVLNNDFTLTIIYTDGERYTTPSIRGPVGATPQFSIGTVQEGPSAAASITGTAENPVLNLTLSNAYVPTRVSELENDSGYLTEHQDLSDYVQKTDYATNSEAGVVKVQGSSGISMVNNTLTIAGANATMIKQGTDIFRPIIPGRQEISTFYGLAKAAGDTTQSQSSNAVGAYTNEAKAAIQSMLDVPSNADIPTQVSELTNDAGYLTTETDPTVPAWAKAAQKPTYTASEVGAPTVAEMNTAIGTAIGQINSFDMAVVQTLPTQDISTHTIYLVPKTGETNDVYDEYVYINNGWEMVGNTQIDLSDYALKSELPEVPVQDVQVNGTSILSNGIANVPMANNLRLGVVKFNPTTYGVGVRNDGIVVTASADGTQLKEGTNGYKPITPNRQHESAFYGLAKAAGDSTQSASNNAIGTYTDEAKAAIQQMLGVPSTSEIPDVPVQDVQVNGTSMVSNGIANLPVADRSTIGVVRIGNGFLMGTGSTNLDEINILRAGTTKVKAGTESYNPIVPEKQHESVFYGLSKVAGVDLANENVTLGTYPESAKTAIRSMLGATSNNVIAVQDATPTDPDTKIWLPETSTAGIQVPTVQEMEAAINSAAIDVQVNGTSIVSNGVANVPVASSSRLGVLKAMSEYGIAILSTGDLYIQTALEAEVKGGTASYRPITPVRQHESTFYGLSKAAGIDLANETVTLGTYPETSKTAIRTMLGATSNNVIAVQDTQPTDPDTKIWLPETAGTSVQVPTVAEMNTALAGKIDDVQINGTSVVSGNVANMPVASTSGLGVSGVDGSFGILVNNNGKLYTNTPNLNEIKAGTQGYKPIVSANAYTASFYGLAKAAGDTTQSQSDNAVGTYTDNAKSAIRTMLGAVGTTDYATSDNVGIVKAKNFGIKVNNEGELYISKAVIDSEVKPGTSNYLPIVPSNQHAATFYGLAKASGDTTQAASSNAVGTYTNEAKAAIKSMIGVNVEDVQVNGTSVLSNGVANIPVADLGVFGVLKVGDSYTGLQKDASGYLKTAPASSSYIKSASSSNSGCIYKPLTPYLQHEATFYGLAKAAGDTTQSTSDNTVGTYTDNAKASIKSMLGIVDGSTGTVEVTGTTPTITAVENTRYVCGEVATLSFTPPASGISIVRFTSGTTATVITLPNTVIFPEWFDATTLEANTVYEICITDGIYGAVMSWAQ